MSSRLLPRGNLLLLDLCPARRSRTIGPLLAEERRRPPRSRRQLYFRGEVQAGLRPDRLKAACGVPVAVSIWRQAFDSRTGIARPDRPEKTRRRLVQSQRILCRRRECHSAHRLPYRLACNRCRAPSASCSVPSAPAISGGPEASFTGSKATFAPVETLRGQPQQPEGQGEARREKPRERRNQSAHAPIPRLASRAPPRPQPKRQ